MNKLRLLQLDGVHLDGDFINLSPELRWLYWNGFPSTYAPADLQKESLVAVELKYSNLKYIWKEESYIQVLFYILLMFFFLSLLIFPRSSKF